jgi:hypothetical protein
LKDYVGRTTHGTSDPSRRQRLAFRTILLQDRDPFREEDPNGRGS